MHEVVCVFCVWVDGLRFYSDYLMVAVGAYVWRCEWHVGSRLLDLKLMMVCC